MPYFKRFWLFCRSVLVTIRRMAVLLPALFFAAEAYAVAPDGQPEGGGMTGEKAEQKKAGIGLSPDQLKPFGTMGKELSVLSGGREAELLNYKGRGCINHMWFGGA